MDEKLVRETYHVWWLYLQHNPSYRRLCELWHEDHQTVVEGKAEGFQKDADGRDHPLLEAHLFFGDVRDVPFYVWWAREKSDRPIQLLLQGSASYQHRMPLVNESMSASEPELIRNFADWFDFYSALLINSFRLFHGTDPSIKDFLKDFRKHVLNMPQFPVLQIDLLGGSVKEIRGAFEKTISDLRKETRLRSAVAHYNRNALPTTILRDEECEMYRRYLLMFTMCDIEGNTIPETFEKMCFLTENEESLTEDTRRYYLRRARETMRSIEQGIFPGFSSNIT